MALWRSCLLLGVIKNNQKTAFLAWNCSSLSCLYFYIFLFFFLRGRWWWKWLKVWCRAGKKEKISRGCHLLAFERERQSKTRARRGVRHDWPHLECPLCLGCARETLCHGHSKNLKIYESKRQFNMTLVTAADAAWIITVNEPQVWACPLF